MKIINTRRRFIRTFEGFFIIEVGEIGTLTGRNFADVLVGVSFGGIEFLTKNGWALYETV